MMTPGIGYSGKTAQAIRTDYTTWREACCVSPTNNRFTRKTRNRYHLDTQGPTFSTERDSGYKRHFVLGTTPGLAANQFTAKTRFIHLNIATQRILSVTFDHCPHQLLLYQTSRELTHGQLPFKVE
jgi:hypothetical protein